MRKLLYPKVIIAKCSTVNNGWFSSRTMGAHRVSVWKVIIECRNMSVEHIGFLVVIAQEFVFGRGLLKVEVCRWNILGLWL